MKPRNILLIIIIFFILFIFNHRIWAYEDYKKKDVVIFSIFSKVSNVPDSVLQSINSSIENVFGSSKRFNVYYYPNLQMDLNYIDDLILKIKQIRENSYSGQQDSIFGNLVINYSDLYKFSQSFYIVVSNLSYFSQYLDKSQDKTRYVCELVVNVKIINVESYKIEADILIKDKSYSEKDISDAELKSINSFQTTLRNKVYELDMFKLKAGIIKREGNLVYISIGEFVGVVSGHEFIVVGKEKIGEKFIEKEVGLIRIKSVSKDIAMGVILIENQTITEGDQIKEFVRNISIGIDNSYYLTGLKVNIPYNIYATDQTLPEISSLFGGGFNLRVYFDFNKYFLVGAEAYIYKLPFINYFGGMGYSFFIRRLITSIELNFCLLDLGIYSVENSYSSRTFGVRALLNFEFLLSPYSSILLSGGYCIFVPFNEIIYFDKDKNQYKYFLQNPISINDFFIRLSYNLRL
ncbi:MAG: hypothetical protein N3A58_06510 [Spirochaetes bacterium]|nr:hypothetical protein [Spirochaetota bacterium]